MNKALLGLCSSGWGAERQTDWPATAICAGSEQGEGLVKKQSDWGFMLLNAFTI